MLTLEQECFLKFLNRPICCLKSVCDHNLLMLSSMAGHMSVLLSYMVDMLLHLTEGRRGQGVQRGPAGAAVGPPADPDAAHPPGSVPLPGAQGEGQGSNFAVIGHATGCELCHPACLCMCSGLKLIIVMPRFVHCHMG